MSGKYTPEPWRAERAKGIPLVGYLLAAGAIKGDARRVLALYLSRQDADRIVACVNALAGVPTEALEKGAVKELVMAARSHAGPPAGEPPSEWRRNLRESLVPFKDMP